MKKSVKITICIATPILLAIAIAFGATASFLKQSLKAVDVETYMTSGNGVTVNDTKDYIFFDSATTEKAIVMYGGANVEEKAYSPICRKLAESDYDVFLLKTFEEFALFDMNKADVVLNNYSYKSVSLMGHSLGGVVATRYMVSSNHKFDNLIYLASYSDKDIKGMDLNVISIQGTLDGVINKKSIEESHEYMPSSFHELWIEGGNHAQFGSYGKQEKDNDATITVIEQTKQTCDFILANIR